MIVSMGIPLGLHVLSAVVWVGGMFFAYNCLRPSMAQLAPAERTALWGRTLGRFFGWVGCAIVLILGSGFWMVHMEGGLAAAQLRVHLMLAVGGLMMLLFLHVLFAPYRRLRRAGGPLLAAAAHPGYSDTNLQMVGPEQDKSALARLAMVVGNRIFAQPASQGALSTLYAATMPDVAGGDYIGPDGLGEMRGYPKKVGCRRLARDEALQGRWWALSEKLTGVKYP